MLRHSSIVGRSRWLAVVVALAALPLLAASGLAQDATPAGEAGDGPHPAHIHSGSCDQLGDVVVPLHDVAVREGEQRGSGAGHEVKGSLTVVDMPLDEILDGGHAINVHLSAEEIDVYIACGDISGAVSEDADDGERHMVIGLGELNDSGHTGIAYITEEGEQTEVAVALIEPDDMS